MVKKQATRWQPYKQQFLQHDVTVIANRATDILAKLLKLPTYQERGRQGGILVLVPDTMCRANIALTIGKVPDFQRPNYHLLALAKCVELRDNENAISTETSGNKSKHEFRGALKIEVETDPILSITPFNWPPEVPTTEKMFLAFEGLPELANEALVLTLSIDMNWASIQDAENVASISTNPYFHPLYKATRKPAVTKTT